MAKGIVRYTMLSLVGEGGFGKVYRARLRGDDGFEREVAVKILHDDHPPRQLLERFRDEARILGLLRDRAIVGVQPPVRIAGRWAVVMDFVDGESLGGMVARAPIPPGVAVEIVGEVARALHCAYHQAGPDGRPLELIHRDIKPDNVQITPAGEVKILDFGIAKATFAEREAKTKQAFAGTPGYIAPERTQGTEHPVGDVYSLGVVLHEIVLGTRPKMPATVVLEDAVPKVSREDLEVPDPDALDGHVREVLELAAWMRAYDHQERPSARQVEDLCRGLRQRIPGEWLRTWAEREVAQRVDLAADDRIGQTFVEEDEGGPTQLHGTPAPAPSVIVPAIPPTPAVVEPTGPRVDSIGLAAGAAFGVSGLLVVGAIGLFLLTLGVVGVVLWRVPGPELATTAGDPERPAAPETPPEPPPPTEPRAPAPEVPAPTPDPPRPSDPADPGAAPRPIAPAPPPRPRDRVIDLTGGGGSTPVGDQPGADRGPGAGRRTGKLLLTTIPSGATVRVHGEVVTGANNTYVLPVGFVTVEITSPAGERHPIPVEIREERPVSVCYNFDTDARCAGP